MFDKSFFAAKIRLHNDSSVVQSVERRTVNPYVTGSSPVRGAKFLFSAILANLFQILIQQASMGTHPGAFLVFSPPCREMRALSLLRIACPTSPLTTRQLSA